MKLNFTFKHLDHSDALENYAQNELDRIAAFLLKEVQGQVQFSKSRKKFQVEVSIPSSLRYFRAQSAHFDPYTAVDEVVAKLEKQILKVRKLNKDHKKFRLSKSGRLSELNDRFEVSARYRKAA